LNGLELTSKRYVSEIALFSLDFTLKRAGDCRSCLPFHCPIAGVVEATLNCLKASGLPLEALEEALVGSSPGKG